MAKAYPAEPIHFVADDREQQAGIIKILRGFRNVEVTVSRLAVADYIVDDKLHVERKTLRDLTASIKDHRLFKQACQLLRYTDHPVMILEGSGADLQYCQMPRECIQGALISITLILGIPILRAMNAAETANLMIYSAHQVRSAKIGAYPRGGYRPKGRKKMQYRILQGLPSVGPGRAQELLDHFTTVENVMSAPEEELINVAGIGQATAKKIRWALKELPGNYVV
ncbi:MAG: ERCC4 domain-containing protein [Lentisphaeria bacterium]